jgi:hypothetical protein
MSRHYVEAFVEGSTALLEYGWQCLTCKDEATGYETLADANDSADEHARSAS